MELADLSSFEIIHTMPRQPVPALKLFTVDSGADAADCPLELSPFDAAAHPRAFTTDYPLEVSEQITDRVIQVLASGLGILEAQFGAVYLLDDETRYLTLGPCCGEQADMPVPGVRMLRQSPADFKALNGNIVTLKTQQRLTCSNAPGVAEAGICVPLVWDDIAIGTLWFFFQQTIEFNEQQVSLVELIALRVADYLMGTLSDPVDVNRHRIVEQTKEWQQNRLVDPAVRYQKWDVRAWMNTQVPAYRTFYDWQQTPTGLSISLAQTQGLYVEAALSAAVIQDTLRSAQRQVHTPAEILETANASIWQGCTGDQFADVLQLFLDADHARVTYSQAGEIMLFCLSRAVAEPLNSYAPEIGITDYGEYENHCQRLRSGDFLLALTEMALAAVTGADLAEKRNTLENTIGNTDLLSAGDVLHKVENLIKPRGLMDRDAAVVVVKYLG